MNMRTRIVHHLLQGIAICFLLAGPGHAQDSGLGLPDDAVSVQSETVERGEMRFATGPWMDGMLPRSGVAGRVQTSILQAGFREGERAAEAVARVAASIEAALIRRGFQISLSCADVECGGFDFRDGLDMGESPTMFVDLGLFRYVSAVTDDGRRAVAATISAGPSRLYIHVRTVEPRDAPPQATASTLSRGNAASAEVADDAPGTGSFIERLTNQGSAALDDLNFGTSAADLSVDGSPSLRQLADFLDANAARSVILVGHTDAQGSREGNLALSTARARSVMEFLIEELSVRPGQVEAVGVGMLAPRATNATPEGRAANRRVEVILLPPQ